MTDDVEGKTDQVDTTIEGQVDTTAAAEIIDDDPMIASMKEAQAELAKGEGKTEGESAEGTTQPPGADQTVKPEGDKTVPIMVPKGRLDKVLSERDQLRDKVNFLEGVASVRKEMLKGGGASAATGGQAGTTSETPDHNALILKAEDDKLALATKYENGEISLVDFKKGEIEADRQIRKIEDERTKALVDGAERKASETIAANNKQMSVEDAALNIQEQHPFVAEIDSLPAAIRDGIWAEITKEASSALASKGINVADGSVASHVALMQEKAKLTDVYGPRYTGKTLDKPNADGKTKTQPSETARNRAAKLALAETQPPDTSGVGVGGNTSTELTEKDIENMSQDQIADALARNPNVIQKAAGFKNR